MGGDPGEGALYAVAAAAIAVGVQYAHNKIQEYQAAKAYRAAHAPTADQAGKVSPANHGYVRRVGLRKFTLSKPATTEIGKQVQAGVRINPTPDSNHPQHRPYKVDVSVRVPGLTNPIRIFGRYNEVIRNLPKVFGQIQTGGDISFNITIEIYGQGGRPIDNIIYQGPGFNYVRPGGSSGL